MKKITRCTIYAAITTISLSLTTNGAENTAATTSINPLSHAERAANLYGRELISSDNQKVGKVDNVIVDLESEHILYVVLDTSRGKVSIAPQLIGNTTGNALQASVDKQKIEDAPRFTNDIDQPAQLGQASFVYSVYQYFGLNPWWKGNAAANVGEFHNVHRLNQLIGMTVEDLNNQSIGKISNVVVDMPSGRLLYVVFSPGSSLNLGNSLFAMPPDAFTLAGDQKHLVTGINRQKLVSAPHFANGNWPNVNDLNFASQVYQYYGKQAWFNTGTPTLQPTGR